MAHDTTMRRFMRGGAVTALGQLVSTAVSLISIVVLSRLLPPSDFGLIAMVGVVTSLGTVLRDMGLGVAALRAEKLSHQQASNLFWTNSVLSLAAASIVGVSGPFLAEIYSDQRLVAITPALALSMLFGGLQTQFQVQMARSQQFGALAAVNAVSTTLGLLVAVSGAWLGLGYWALVAQLVAVNFTELVSKVLLSKWLPKRPQRLSGTKPLALAGLDVAGANVVQYFSSNAATFMIGMRMGAADVGLYSRAFSLITLPSSLLGPLINVAIPVLREAAERGEDPNPQLLRMQSFLATWTGFILSLVAAIAPSLFVTVLGPDWEAAAPVFRLLAVGGVVGALTQINLWGFLIHDQTRTLLRYNLISKPLTTVLVVMGALISLPATAAAYSLARVLSWLVGVLWLQSVAQVSAKAYLLNGARILLSSTAAASVAIGAGYLLPDTLVLQLLLPALSCVLVFLVFTGATQQGRGELRIAWAEVKRITMRRV